MAGRRLLPDVPTLLRHVDQGMTHQEIGKLYGTSRQAVTLKLQGATEPRNHRREWPWDVQTRHKKGWFYLALSYYQIAQSKERPLRKQEQHTLSSFLDMMDSYGGQYVVDYDPNTAVGLHLRPRDPERDDPESLIGVPEVGLRAG